MTTTYLDESQQLAASCRTFDVSHHTGRPCVYAVDAESGFDLVCGCRSGELGSAAAERIAAALNLVRGLDTAQIQRLADASAFVLKRETDASARSWQYVSRKGP